MHDYEHELNYIIIDNLMIKSSVTVSSEWFVVVESDLSIEFNSLIGVAKQYLHVPVGETDAKYEKNL